MNYKKRRTIMVIEDDTDFLHCVKQMLSDEYDIIATGDGVNALESINVRIPDLILIDILLPFPLDGFSILRILKCNPNYANIPIIFMSGLSDEKKITEGLELGANDYLVKPFSFKHLYLKINNLLSFKSTDSSDYQITNELMSKITNDINGRFELEFKNKFDKVVESLVDEPSVSINVFSEKMSMSVSTLERWVSKIYGITPMKYLQDIKLVKAEMLLRQKQINVKDVSFVLGYNSVPYFCFCFKKKYGMSPKAFSEYHKMKVLA